MERVLAELEVDYVEFKPLKDDDLRDVFDQISSKEKKPDRKIVGGRRRKDIADVIDEVLAEVGVSFELNGYHCVKTDYATLI